MCANAPVAGSACATSSLQEPATLPADVPAPVDLKDTLHLPQTDFPMRAGLAELEPRLLEDWARQDLYAELRARSAGQPLFTLHDGPPYANGHLHMGHALNKVLKDMAVRTAQMSGRDARFVPGWDCHGLPIEWKVEADYRKRGLSKEDVPALEFRQACRDYAAHWVEVQKAEFQRLGVNADWKRPYLTMDAANEAAVAREFLTFLMNGTLYQSSKPVMWSPVEKTALAEAEVEYHDRKTRAVWVAYPVAETTEDLSFSSTADLAGAFLVAWTTTPWTLPSSEALCYGPSLSYGLYEVARTVQAAGASPADASSVSAPLAGTPSTGTRLLLVDAAADRAARAMKAELVRLRDVACDELADLRVRHPLHGVDAEWDRGLPVLPADHVRDDAGSGFVHTAPSHGDDDYKVGRAYGLPMVHNLMDDGRLRADMPVFGGLAVVNQDGSRGPADAELVAALNAAGTLFGSETVVHSYPHSWRSGAPVLFRATPQWFVGVDRPVGDGQDRLGTTMRARALAALEEVEWLPKVSRNRLGAMLRDRPDWVLSRQRAWGVPLTLFTRRDLAPDHPDFVLRDAAVNARVLAVFGTEGADAWYAPGAKARFLASDHDPDLYDQCMDVLDVWFESGSSHAFVLGDREDGPDDGVADLYLEGTDQHRGWFQASLLQSVGTRGRAPFRKVLTHGFALDGKGKKMSKSLGNVVSPADVVKNQGADVLRLWVARADYTGDFKAGADALKGASETFRKLRNTLRYMLGALNGHDPATLVERGTLPLLERWVLHRASEVSAQVSAACASYDFATAVQVVHDFCAHDLSSVFFETRKDALYCDAKLSPRRQAALSTMSVCLDACLSWLAPVLVFTAEEAWRHRHGAAGVHLARFPCLDQWQDSEAARQMQRLLALRSEAHGALEGARTTGTLTKSTHARLDVGLAREDLPAGVSLQDLADLCVVAEVRAVGDGSDRVEPSDRRPTVSVHPAEGTECPRCRLVAPPVKDDLCGRCTEVLAQPHQARCGH